MSACYYEVKRLHAERPIADRSPLRTAYISTYAQRCIIRSLSLSLSLHPTSLVRSTVSKTASSPCTPGAAAIRYPSIPTNPSLFSLVLGNVLMLSRTLPRSISWARCSSDHVQLLGVTLDNRLSMDKHVNEVSRAFFIIYVHCDISDQPSPPKRLCSRYADGLYGGLYGVSSKNKNYLQRIQNALARCVVDSKLHRGSNALLQLNSSVSQYLSSRSLRSQDTCLLAVPRCKTSHRRANRF